MSHEIDTSDHVLVIPDKFRSTASANELARAMAKAVRDDGYVPVIAKISDGGEGLLEALGGTLHSTVVTGPLGDRVRADWRTRVAPNGSKTAIIEMARASGLDLVGDAAQNDPIGATTRGTGELIRAALLAGATSIIVGCGGSATTDGGIGAVEVLSDLLPRSGITLKVACDVTTTFVEAASVFGPQKGATAQQVAQLRTRLEHLAASYEAKYRVDLSELPRAGAAGGLAGGLAALGGELVSGVALVADETGLNDLIRDCALVITGEGRFDSTSRSGKVVGELIERTRDIVPLLIVVGEANATIDDTKDPHVMLVSLSERFGGERSRHDTLACVTAITREAIAELLPPRPSLS